MLHTIFITGFQEIRFKNLVNPLMSKYMLKIQKISMRKKEALTHIEDMFSLYPYINRICEM